MSAKARRIGVPMEQALDQQECLIVREFLATLCTMHRKHGKCDVGKFMKEYAFILNGDYSKGRKERCDKFWTEERIAEAVKMRKSGMYWKDIGKHYGITDSAIMQAIGKYVD